MSYKFQRKLFTETVTLKSGETQPNYIKGIYANIYCTDSDTGDSVCRNTIVLLTDPSEKNKSDFTELENLSAIPDVAKTNAEEVLADNVLIQQMTNDLEIKKKNREVQNASSWSGDFDD